MSQRTETAEHHNYELELHPSGAVSWQVMTASYFGQLTEVQADLLVSEVCQSQCRERLKMCDTRH